MALRVNYRWLLLAAVAVLAGCKFSADINCGESTELTTVWGESSLAQPLYAVVAEGAAEPKSMGSYSVRIYQHGDGGGARDVFLSGEIFARDGFLHSVSLADVDGDQLEELVVVFESAGTGSYVTAHAWHYLDGDLSVIASVDSLLPGVDIIEAIKAQIRGLNALEPESTSAGEEPAVQP